MRIKQLGVLLLAAILTGSAGCAPVQENRQVFIGIMGDKEMYDYDSSILNAVTMAVEDVNEQYTDLYTSVEYYDDGTIYERGVQQASALVNDDKITAVLGTHSYIIMDMAAELANQEDKLMIAFNGCNDNLLSKGYPTVFCNLYGAGQSGQTLAEYVATQPDISRIAVYSGAVSYEPDFVSAFAHTLTGLSASIVDCAPTVTDAQEFETLASRWRALDVDAILIVQYYAEDSFQAAETFSRLLPEARLMGDSSFDYRELLAEYSVQTEGLVIPEVLLASQDTSFDTRYMQRYGTKPSRWAAHAYDSVRMIVDTAANIDSTDSQAIAQTLHEENGYQGVNGVYQFDQNGKLKSGDQRMLICQAGSFVPLS